MTSRLLIGLLALALLAAGSFAGARSGFAAARVAAPEPAMLHASGPTEGAVVTAGTPCTRGGTAAGGCSTEQGLPVQVAGSERLPAGIGVECASRPMAGHSPGCLVGPPRRR